MSKGYNFLGERIKKIRSLFRYSQEELGKILNLPKQSISRIEKGKRAVSEEELKLLSKELHVPERFIIEEGWVENMYEESLPKNRWGISLPQFSEDFVEGLEEYLDYQLDSGMYNYKTIKEIISGTIKTLDLLLKEFKEKSK